MMTEMEQKAYKAGAEAMRALVVSKCDAVAARLRITPDDSDYLGLGEEIELAMRSAAEAIGRGVRAIRLNLPTDTKNPPQG